MYPRLDIDLGKLRENAVRLVSACRENGISDVFLVTKVLAGDLRTVQAIAGAGFTHLADSRIENLIRFASVPLPKVLLRLPMPDEADRVVRHADLSLVSESATIAALGRAALRQGKIHGVLLMVDLGDLREGVWYADDPVGAAAEAATVPGIRLEGIGTNLTCFGGILPDADNLGRLAAIAAAVERRIGRPLPLVSGGNSSTIHLFGQAVIPNAVNALRLGEAVYLGRETAYGAIVAGLHPDVFTLRAEVIEAKTKPSRPQGTVGMNAFGEHPVHVDVGPMRRGLLALGRQDVEPGDLAARDPRIRIVGASSDHLIVDLGDTGLSVGDTVAFDVNYGGLLRLMTSRYVHKRRIP